MRRLRPRRLLRGVSIVLVIAGGVLLLDAVVTLAWQEPITAVMARAGQRRAAAEFRTLRHGPLPGVDLQMLTSLRGWATRARYEARTLRHRVREGLGIGHIDLPSIGAHFAVVEGTSSSDLKRGPGFYTWTGLPGENRPVAIAGHRTTYLAPFRHIDRLRAGDEIGVQMPYAVFTYRVTGHRIVSPSDVRVVTGAHPRQLVLTACHPLYSAAKRYVVFARLVSMDHPRPDR